MSLSGRGFLGTVLNLRPRSARISCASPSRAARKRTDSSASTGSLRPECPQVMGWEGYHLYQFVVGGIEYSDPRVLEEMEGEDAQRVALATLVWDEKYKCL